jgi:hypothetical protein
MPCDTVLVLAALDMLVPITADRERERDAAIERERLARLAFEERETMWMQREARLPDPRLDALLAAVRDVLDGGGVVRSTALRDALAAFEETP